MSNLKKTKFNCLLHINLKKQLKQYAKKEGISMTTAIIFILKNFFEIQKNKNLKNKKDEELNIYDY